MDGSFACPECGCEIRLKGLSPGRQVPCDWCRTLVEVPYIPRSDQIRRMRRERSRSRRRGWPAWASVACVVLGIGIAVAAAGRIVSSKRISAETDALNRLIQASHQAQSAGQLGDALSELEAAVALAKSYSPPPSNLSELLQERDRLSLREAGIQLGSLEGHAFDIDPARAVGRALTLAARLRVDPALAPLSERIEIEVDRLRILKAEAEGKAAVTAFNAFRPVESWNHCLQQYQTAEPLSHTPRARLQKEATDLAAQLVSRHGVVVEPTHGAFTLGSPTAYDETLYPILSDALKQRSYLPRVASSPWTEFWNTHAPFRMSIEVTERHLDPYFSSPNLTSTVEVVVTLAASDQKLWEERARGRTQIPVPKLPAYMASRLAVSKRRSPDFERVLYDNALNNMVDRLRHTLNAIPECRSDALSQAGLH